MLPFNNVDNFLSRIKKAELRNESCYGILTAMEKFVTLKKKKRKRKHGFLSRMKSFGGRATIKRRRSQGRKKLAI